jgi:hypothetical protein
MVEFLLTWLGGEGSLGVMVMMVITVTVVPKINANFNDERTSNFRLGIEIKNGIENKPT